MTADPLEARARTVRLGPPDWRLGPWTLRRRGGSYRVATVTLDQAKLLAEQCLVAWELIVDGVKVLGDEGGAFCVRALRALLPLLLDGPVERRDWASATPEQIRETFAAFTAVNSMQQLVEDLLARIPPPGGEHRGVNAPSERTVN